MTKSKPGADGQLRRDGSLTRVRGRLSRAQGTGGGFLILSRRVQEAPGCAAVEEGAQ